MPRPSHPPLPPRSPEPRPPHTDGAADPAHEARLALIERARQLGATAQELEQALAALAAQAEAVLHRLRGGPLQ